MVDLVLAGLRQVLAEFADALPSVRQAGGGWTVSVDAASLRERIRRRVRSIVAGGWGDHPASFLDELAVPALSADWSGGYAAEQARTAHIASLAALATSMMALSGILRSGTAAELACDLLLDDGCGSGGIRPIRERRRIAHDRDRCRRGISRSLQLRIYEAVAPQLVEAVCRLGMARDGVAFMASRS